MSKGGFLTDISGHACENRQKRGGRAGGHRRKSKGGPRRLNMGTGMRKGTGEEWRGNGMKMKATGGEKELDRSHLRKEENKKLNRAVRLRGIGPARANANSFIIG